MQAGEVCPVCQVGTMVVRTSRMEGSKFLGCSKFPACRTTGKYAPLAVSNPVVATKAVDNDDIAPPMIPAKPIDCINPAKSEIPEGTTTGKVQRCFELLLRLVLCEGCQDRRVSEVKDRLTASYDAATIESLRKASKQPTRDKP